MRSSHWLTTRLIGDPVRNSAGATLGNINDLIIDPSTGQTEFAVIRTDTVGADDRFVAVPWNALGLVTGRDYVLLDIDKITLERGPSFSAHEWPDFTDPVWRSRVYQYYGVADSAVIPDHVVVEQRAYPVPRKEMSVWARLFLFLIFLGLASFLYLVTTRGWQQAKTDMLRSFYDVGYAMKEDTADATITAKVKMAISLNKDVSSADIHVDTDSGIVTLRGQVSDDQTRAIAGKIAGETPGVLQVDNELKTPVR